LRLKKAVELLQADGLILHLNPLQEALQTEGNTNFAGLANKIEKICAGISVPVIVKEVGWGIGLATARMLVNIGVQALDIAGAGGTSWSEVEKYRTANDSRYRIASHFKSWGIPTAEALISVHNAIPDLPLVASGGITNGLEVAKSISLGASIAGIARPFLLAANQSTSSVVDLIEEVKTELAITMFAAGVKDISALKQLKLIQLKSTPHA
jgi:isopentenyl-diphosphate delta-isomerase